MRYLLSVRDIFGIEIVRSIPIDIIKDIKIYLKKNKFINY